MTLTKDFSQWVKEKSLNSYTAIFTLVDNNSDSVYLDVEAKTVFARITMWNSGSCDMETVDAKSGSQTFWKNYIFDDWISAHRIIESFIEDVLNK